MDKGYMSRFVRYIIAGICLLICSVWADAQVLVKASIDRDKILVGEPIILTLDVRTPLGQDVSWFNLDSLPHFEFLQKAKIDTIESVDGKKWQQQLTITSYDSGYWQIPILSMKVDGKVYYSDTLGVEVGYANTDLSQDYKDIKEIEDVPNTDTGYIPWIIGGATLVALAVMVYLFRKKKVAAKPQAVVVKLTPYEESMQALETLRKKDLLNKGEVKTYYTELNDILRVFVMRKLRIASMEKTNEELIGELRKLRMNQEYFHELTNALQMADFVKFARYQPDAEESEKNFTTIQSAITTLNNIA
jgi:LPXTG-motif cell wall-anchored protein